MARKPTVLLVEDNSGDVHLLREAFFEIGFPLNLDIALTGTAALAYLRDRNTAGNPLQPDLILLDLNLPGLHGLEALEIIRNDPLLKVIPVIILSSSANEQDIASARALRANDYIIKPNDFENLLAVASQIARYCEQLPS